MSESISLVHVNSLQKYLKVSLAALVISNAEYTAATRVLMLNITILKSWPK